VPIIWHDEIIDKTKCRDTVAAYANDTVFPYVGKNVANLTLAQIKTLDCGSIRLDGFPLQGKFTRHAHASLLIACRGLRRDQALDPR
jgi:hypothetical protein